METITEEITIQAADQDPDMAAGLPEPAEIAGDPEEVEFERFVGQTMTPQRAAVVAFEVSSEGMGV